MTNNELADLLEEAAGALRKLAESSPRRSKMSLPTLLTDVQLAEKLAISQRHVHSLMVRKAIPYIKLGRSTRFNLDDVEKAIARMTIREVGHKKTSPAGA